MSPIVLIGLVVVVILVVVVVRQRSGGGPKKKDNAFTDAGEGKRPRKSSAATSVVVVEEEAEGGEALPAWGGFDGWDSPEAADTTYDTDYQSGSFDDSDGGGLATWDSGTSWGEEVVEETTTESSWDSGDSWSSGESWDSGDSWGDTATEESATDIDAEFVETFGEDTSGGFESESSYGGFDDVPVAPSSGGGLFSVPAPINEDVSTADDIMAASAATELHIGAPAEEEEAGPADNSELAKLLAKVQARLSAYE